MQARSLLVALTALPALTLLATIAACSGAGDQSGNRPGGAGTSETTDPSAAASAEDLGGMDALVAAAREEGRLNVIGLRPDWVDYAAVIQGFTRKYGIQVTSLQPDATSQQEIDAARDATGDAVPDVFDVNQAVALANLDLFAPYRVATWDDIPDHLKQPDGTAVADYGGYMSVGYDAGKVGTLDSVDDLAAPGFTGKVALTGDPTREGGALNAVRMVSLAEGGTAADAAPGVTFLARLRQAGHLLTTPATDKTVLAGRTSVVLDWDYLNLRLAPLLPTWRVFVPADAAVAGYYYQAVNKEAAHPAAARLWEEYLYSDEGQNLWLQGGARPVRAEAMEAAGTIDAEAYAKLPKVTGTPVIPTPEQTATMAEYLAAHWAGAVG